jgi:hypothetical protein
VSSQKGTLNIQGSVEVGAIWRWLCVQDGMWVIYNDEKVAKSENPPTEFGYMYLYKQKK